MQPPLSPPSNDAAASSSTVVVADVVSPAAAGSADPGLRPFAAASDSPQTPRVVKRGGERSEDFDPAKLRQRLDAVIGRSVPAKDLCHVDLDLVVQKVGEGLLNQMSSAQLEEYATETVASMATRHPAYLKLASAMVVSRMHKETSADIREVADRLFTNVDPKTGKAAPLLASAYVDVVRRNSALIGSKIDFDRDYGYDYFGIVTLWKTYLMRSNGVVVERPQHLLMRVALGLHCVVSVDCDLSAERRDHDVHLKAADTPENLAAAFETYDLMSNFWCTHASPTLFNAGTPRCQMSSCFLIAMKDDSLEGIYDTLKACAQISKWAGGVGLWVHNIRASGSYIRGTNGSSNGLVPMLKVYNDTAKYVDQGGAKRPGAFAIYLEPWHPDIFAFLNLRKNTGKDELRARDLFYALWVPDLFMQRVEENGDWPLFCPAECPGLYDCWGPKFKALYERYESEGKARQTVKARELWNAILDAQVETGQPYMLYKDAINAKSNQQNLGTIKCSNLCTEIVEYSSPEEQAVCNLASIALSQFVVPANSLSGSAAYFDFRRLYEVTVILTRNLNKVIDVNDYPTPETKRSNLRHRPVGLGVQGLADAFFRLRLPFDGPDARTLNRDIFETIYFAALTASCELAAKDGPYSTYEGSPASRGVLQHDMWGVTPSPRWNWASLKARIAEHGLRNSLLVAPMPTASTSQILGNYECFEAATSNLYARRVTSGDFVVFNRYLVDDLVERGLWDDAMRNELKANHGSVQNIARIPADLRELYKTVWEIRQTHVIDMAADRGAFIDQSHSLNWHVANPSRAKLNTLHFRAWKAGLKTGMYYLRTQNAANAIQFTVDKSAIAAGGGATPADGEEPAGESSAASATGEKRSREDGGVGEESSVKRRRFDCSGSEECTLCSS